MSALQRRDTRTLPKRQISIYATVVIAIFITANQTNFKNQKNYLHTFKSYKKNKPKQMQQRTAYDQNWKEIVTHLTAEFIECKFVCHSNKARRPAAFNFQKETLRIGSGSKL